MKTVCCEYTFLVYHKLIRMLVGSYSSSLLAGHTCVTWHFVPNENISLAQDLHYSLTLMNRLGQACNC